MKITEPLFTTVALASLLLLSNVADARSYEVLILGGGKTKADAEKFVSKFDADRAGLVSAKGYPRTFRSDDIAGLKPGLFIAVLGFCETGTTEPLRKAARTVETGTYLKAVTGEFADACPAIKQPEVDAGEKTLRDAVAKNPKSTGARFEYAVYLEQAARFEEATVQLDEILKLEPSHQGAKDLAGKIMVLTTD